MASLSSTQLVLCGKSSEENEVARSLKTSNAIKLSDGSSVNLVLYSEIENREVIDYDYVFQINSYMNLLSASRFGKFLIYSPRLASTHDVVSNNFNELPIGAVCVADVQFKGRGRSSNVWESPKGCLMFSFTTQMEDGRVVPFVQYVVSLAMTESINDVCRKNGMPPLNVRIKWPNDLYIDGLKVGGILCTSTYRSKKFNISAGIGLNVSNPKPTTSLNATLQRLGCITCELRREDILAAFLNTFEKFYDIFISQGFQALEELYYKAWLHSGQRVIIEEKIEKQDQNSETVVTVQGLTTSGFLLATGEDGQIYELHPDGNRYFLCQNHYPHQPLKKEFDHTITSLSKVNLVRPRVCPWYLAEVTYWIYELLLSVAAVLISLEALSEENSLEKVLICYVSYGGGELSSAKSLASGFSPCFMEHHLQKSLTGFDMGSHLFVSQD